MLLLSRPGPVRAPDPPLAAPLPEAAHARARGVLCGGACAGAPRVRHRPRVHLLGELLARGGHLQGGEDVGAGGGRLRLTPIVIGRGLICQRGWDDYLWMRYELINNDNINNND